MGNPFAKDGIKKKPASHHEGRAEVVAADRPLDYQASRRRQAGFVFLSCIGTDNP